jgi:putative addiction module component (TIGR02574 family)
VSISVRKLESKFLSRINNIEKVSFMLEEKMKTELRNLPIKERVQLVEDIWDSISLDQKILSLSDSQRKELDLRLKSYEVDNNKGNPVKEVLLKIQQLL